MADSRQRLPLPRHLWWITVLCLCAATTVVMARDCECGNHASSARVLSLSAPTLEQPVGPDLATPSSRKFVQIVVTRVINPERLAISFEVYFHSAEGKKSYLGNFSLFPADNPGKFLVATHGLLEAGGRVSVTLVPLQPGAATRSVCAWIGTVKFIE